MTKKIIHLFKNDLRISDNPSFSAACENGDVIPIYILDEGNIYDDSAQGWWLINSLEKLNQSLSNNLYMYSGNYKDVISNLVKKYDIQAVYWNRSYDPYSINRDKDLKLYLNFIFAEIFMIFKNT